LIWPKWNYRTRKCLWCSNDRFTIRKVVEKLRKNSFSIESHPIAEGSKANLSLFTPEGKVFSPKLSYQNLKLSISGNGNKGKVHGIVNQGKLILA
jgi:dihydroorotase